MHYRPNKAGIIIGLLISLPLMGFTTWRTVDLLISVLPPSQSIAAIFGVAAFDGGLVAWTFAYMKAQGSDQRLIASWMIGIDFFAVAIATVLDLVLVATSTDVISASSANTRIISIIVVSVVVVANVGGGLFYALSDPHTKQTMRDQRSHDKITDMADSQIEQHAAMYAPQFAQAKVAMWLQQAQMIHGVGQLMQLPAAPVVESLPPVAQPQPQPQQGLLGKLKSALGGSDNPQPQTSTPVQLSDFERFKAARAIYLAAHPEIIDTPGQAEREWQMRNAEPQTSPLAQPELTKASQNGTNGTH